MSSQLATEKFSNDYKEGVDKWRIARFTELKQIFQNKSSEISTRQDVCDISRKTLIEHIRVFQQTTPEPTRLQVSPLMKEFQKEIDLLNQRSKFSETCFFELLQNISSLPDPVKLLIALNEDYEKYRDEAETKELTLQQLSNKVGRLEDENSEFFEGKLRTKELELKEQARLAQNELEIQIFKLNLENKKMRDDIAKLQEQLRGSQKDSLELRNRHEEDLIARGQELELLMNDLEKSNTHSQNLEAELNKYKSSSSSIDYLLLPNNHQTDSNFVKELEKELNLKDEELENLQTDRQTLQINFDQLTQKLTHIQEKSALDLKSSEERSNKLEAKLASYADYADIKQELEAFRMIEFGATINDPHASHSLNTDINNANNNIDNDNNSSSLPVDVLLIQKNKQLQSECSSLRAERDRLVNSAANKEQTFSANQHKCAMLEEQVEQLEHDIIRMQQLLPTRQEGGVAMMSSQLDSLHNPSPSFHLTDSNAILSEFTMSITKLDSPNSSESTTPPRSRSGRDRDNELIGILLSQRERFKQKHLTLQQDYEQGKLALQELQLKNTSLERDNQRLYEKIRFLQSFSKTNKSAGTTDPFMSRYSEEYESRLDPFTAFNRQEMSRRYSKMPGTDRAIYNIGRIILSNSISRRLALFYLLLVHLLVFGSIYFYAYSLSDAETDCRDEFNHHMIQYHGNLT